MFSSFLQLAVGSHDLSQAEKEISLFKAEQIQKMSTIFSQNDSILHPRPFWVVILWICSAWYQSRDPGANWNKVENMQTTYRSDETFCDVTLVSTKGEQFSAHKVVISACSTQLQSMLKPLPGWQHPVLLMPKDIPTEDLRDILAFMYSGEVWTHLFLLFLWITCF